MSPQLARQSHCVGGIYQFIYPSLEAVNIVDVLTATVQWAMESDVPMFNAWFNHLTHCDLGRVVQLLQTSIFPSVKQASSCPP